MMMMNPKKALSSILAKRRSEMGKDQGSAMMKNEEVRDTDGELDPRHMAAQDIMMALHEKSPHKLSEAMANFYDLHSLHKEGEESNRSEE